MENNLALELIEKEKIETLKFPKDEVLTKKNAIQTRFIKLKRAMALGNLEKGKVRILFKDNMGLKSVETTVWGVTDTSVILKRRALIPLRRIVSVI